MHRTSNLLAAVVGLTVLYMAAIIWVTMIPWRVSDPDEGTVALLIAIGWLSLYAGLVMQVWSWLEAREDRGTGQSILLILLFTMFYGLFAIIFQTSLTSDGDRDTARWSLLVTLPIAAMLIYGKAYSIASRWQNIRFEDIPDGTIAVIKREGKLRRLEEPGSIWLRRNDQIAYLIRTDEQQLIPRTEMLRMGSFVYRYTLKVRYRYVPPTTTPIDPERLQRLSPASVSERREEIQELVQTALYSANTDVYLQIGERAEPDALTCLFHVVPDVSGARSVLSHATEQIVADLAARDIYVQSGRAGIQLDGLAIPEPVKTNTTPAAVSRLLAGWNLESGERTIKAMVTWIERAVPIQMAPKVRTDFLDIAPGTQPRQDGNGQMSARVAAAADTPGADAPSRSETPYVLTPQDLELLQEIPEPDIDTGPEGVGPDAGRGSMSNRYTLSPVDLGIMQVIPD